MKIEAVVFDATPLSLVTMKRGALPEADACQDWLSDLSKAGVRFYVPEITEYEVRRELLRVGKAASLRRLEALVFAEEGRLISLNREALFRAAQLWAQSRNAGLPTANKKAIDADVILAAQVLTCERLPSSFLVATSNVKHLSRYVPCADWKAIQP